MARPRHGARPDSREQILKAAAEEFAAHGFAGAGVDRIARRARVNKSLLYYYFGSKRRLYTTVLQDGLVGLTTRLREAVAAIDDPAARLDRYIETLLDAHEERPHLPPIIMRELADGGRHLDADTLRLITGILGVVSGVLADGERRGVFRRVDPLMTHFVIMGSAVFFAANRDIRRRVRRLGLAQPPLAAAPFIRHLQMVARRTVCKDGTQ
jgi:AcrR family transcriptional regulator